MYEAWLEAKEVAPGWPYNVHELCPLPATLCEVVEALEGVAAARRR